MHQRIRTHVVAAAVTTALLAAGTVLAPSGAYAEDRRPCVSKVEFQSAPGITHVSGRTSPGRRLPRAQLEAFWDVKGLGVVDPDYSGHAQTMWDYPVCGYGISEAQVWVVTRKRNGVAIAALLWREPGATLHGHPRHTAS